MQRHAPGFRDVCEGRIKAAVVADVDMTAQEESIMHSWTWCAERHNSSSDDTPHIGEYSEWTWRWTNWGAVMARFVPRPRRGRRTSRGYCLGLARVGEREEELRTPIRQRAKVAGPVVPADRLEAVDA